MSVPSPNLVLMLFLELLRRVLKKLIEKMFGDGLCGALIAIGSGLPHIVCPNYLLIGRQQFHRRGLNPVDSGAIHEDATGYLSSRGFFFRKEHAG